MSVEKVNVRGNKYLLAYFLAGMILI